MPNHLQMAVRENSRLRKRYSEAVSRASESIAKLAEMLADAQEELELLKAAAPAVVVGEPVAWMVRNANGALSLFDDEDAARAHAEWAHGPRPVYPLYTAPPARQALTDERIAAMRQAGYLDADDYPDAWAYERGVRDAERAHGIGGMESNPQR